MIRTAGATNKYTSLRERASVLALGYCLGEHWDSVPIGIDPLRGATPREFGMACLLSMSHQQHHRERSRAQGDGENACGSGLLRTGAAEDHYHACQGEGVLKMHDTLSLPHLQIQADDIAQRTFVVRCADCGLRVHARAPSKKFCAACLQDHHNRCYFERYWRDLVWRESIKAYKRVEWATNPKKRERQYRQRRLRVARRRRGLS